MNSLQQNMALAKTYLSPFQADITGHFINGQRVVPDDCAVFENFTPVDNTSLGKVVAGTNADVDAACEAAAAAFAEWRDMPGAERKKLLHNLADKLEGRAEEIAIVESMDCGQALRFMRQAAVRGAANFRFFADKAPEARNGQALYQEKPYQHNTPHAYRPCGYYHPVEYALYVIHMENCACTCIRLYDCT